MRVAVCRWRNSPGEGRAGADADCPGNAGGRRSSLGVLAESKEGEGCERGDGGGVAPVRIHIHGA